ncbi:hypothetical protein BDM02DRAFT_1385736 [Thelephora ganbajun]|uniref:Uncharacterized protein n=1 Tax=Thelephora ganbajun TaxID=370292 RepID=A0ACB6ZLN8_THEGA|nr:hypothetical protein BDM02DRAFT_1385736 [Thelephora ganbajun]
MFSQFRNAVEHLAAQPMLRSTSQDSDTSNIMSRTNSGEGGAPSSTHLADSTLSNIRRSLQAQRSSSPARAGSNGTASTGVHDPNKPRSRLEERLRASLSFGIGEVSNPSTEAPTNATNTPISTKAPTPFPGTDTVPPSPTQTPLPESPISPITENATGSLSSLLNSGDPLGTNSAVSSTSSLSHPLASPTTESESKPQPPVATTCRINDDVPLIQPTPSHYGSRSVDSPSAEKLERVTELEEDEEEFQGRRYAEAQMPLPPTPPPESSKLPSVDLPASNPEHQPDLVDNAGKGNVSPPITVDSSQADPDTEVDSTSATIPSASNADGDTAGTDIEALRQQLKRFKERFTDVSSSFKRLQAEKLAADKLLQELTPLQTIQDTEGLKEYIKNINLQSEMSQDEIKRLNNKLIRQGERIEELRDTHRLESKSQSELIERLRKQAEETEALLHASHSAETTNKESAEKFQSEINNLKAELEKQKGVVKDEEEKRTKAIALLKTVRQKLVKAEKERDDVVREVGELREKDKADKARERVEKIRMHNEIEQANLEREKAVAGLRTQFDKEVALLKDRQEKDIQALQGQFESETAALKNVHAQGVKVLNDKIYSFELANLNLTREKDRLFDQLEMRQAELESSNTHLETLQSRTTEYQYQIREFSDRVALLEAKYEARLSELRGQLETIEKERNEADAEWNSKVATKALEAEELKKVIGRSQKNEIDHEVVEEKLREEITALNEEVRGYQRQQLEFQRQVEKIKESEPCKHN